MKSYFACLAVLLVACAGNAEPTESSPGLAAAPPEMNLPPNDEGYTSPCDRPLQYRDAVVDGQTVRIPIFIACDALPERDHGDPPPDAITTDERSQPAPERVTGETRSASR